MLRKLESVGLFPNISAAYFEAVNENMDSETLDANGESWQSSGAAENSEGYYLVINASANLG
jgi:hypothetical protein